MNKKVEIVETDFSRKDHQQAFIYLMNSYATGITGGGNPIGPESFQRTFRALPQRKDCLLLLVFVDGKPAAIANCFEGYSTFKGKALLNIHDFAVAPQYQGMGLAKLLLEKLEQISKERGYCKITLEVLEGNTRAQKVYLDFGFQGYELDEKMGKALFWEKPLSQ